MVRSRRPAPKFLGKKLLQIRTAFGLSQSEMVRRLDYNASPLYPSQISNFEQTKREPPVLLILAYARVANVPMELLVDDELELPKKLPARSRGKIDWVTKKR